MCQDNAGDARSGGHENGREADARPASGPSMTAAPMPARALVEDLVTANHILADQGVVDAFGHVSVRHDQAPDRFLLARNMAPDIVGADDILQFTLDGEPIDANGRKTYVERFIHGEIYRRRPDVAAVVHSHSPAIVPLTVVKGGTLRALSHMAGFIGTAAPMFEIRDVAGDGTDLLVSDAVRGRALAELFDRDDVVLMRGHGSTVVAPSLRQAVYRAVFAELVRRLKESPEHLPGVLFVPAAVCGAPPEVKPPGCPAGRRGSGTSGACTGCGTSSCGSTPPCSSARSS